MNILVIGYRQGLNRALKNLGIEFSLLLNSEVKFPPKNVKIKTIEKYPNDIDSSNKIAESLIKKGIQPTHIIAATEAAVFPATFLRRSMNCRVSKHSVIKRCTNKFEMKKYLFEQNIPMSKFVSVKETNDPSEIIKRIGLPVVAKDISNSGGRGMKICHTKKELESFIGKKQIYESFNKGSEGSIESYVSHGDIKFTNITEYFITKFSNLVPASYSDEIKKQIISLNEKVIKSLKISWGMTHLEYYITDNGLLFGEIALRPPGGYVMKLMEMAYNFNPWEALIKIELDQEFEFPNSNTSHAACLIYHPGIGKIKQINEPKSKTLQKNTFKLKIGDEIKDRVGVSEDIGYSLFLHEDQKLIKEEVRNLHSTSPFILN